MINLNAHFPKEKIFFQSLGCPKNLVDAEVMLGITQDHPYQIVPNPEEASVIIVNTCSFINDAKRESIDACLELARYKEKGICRRLIMTGCLPQRYKADLMVSFPEVDAFVGTGQYGRILEFIEGKREENLEFAHPKYIHSEHTPRINTQPFYRAYLKLSEGCIKNCAFCIIPKIRGTLRSREIPSLVAEAEKLVSQGVLELNLIAQDLTDYGRDLRNGMNLAGLLRELVKIEGLQWIRLFYVYPDDLSDELLDLIASEKKICEYIDMPIQHISDRMLRLMNRKISGAQIRERVKKLRSKVPGISFRSTVMVGYPGETENEFKELLDFIEEARFDHLGVFAYSLEEETASYLLPDPIDEQTKQRRREEMLGLQQKISSGLLRGKVGEKIPVLIEGSWEESEFLMKGRHQGQAPEIDGIVVVRNCRAEAGSMVEVKIEKAMEYDLMGRARN